MQNRGVCFKFYLHLSYRYLSRQLQSCICLRPHRSQAEWFSENVCCMVLLRFEWYIFGIDSKLILLGMNANCAKNFYLTSSYLIFFSPLFFLGGGGVVLKFVSFFITPFIPVNVILHFISKHSTQANVSVFDSCITKQINKHF